MKSNKPKDASDQIQDVLGEVMKVRHVLKLCERHTWLTFEAFSQTSETEDTTDTVHQMGYLNTVLGIAIQQICDLETALEKAHLEIRKEELDGDSKARA